MFLWFITKFSFHCILYVVYFGNVADLEAYTFLY